jgi:gamma-glutamyltranspeptidase/glutathione hydrolase
MDHQILPHVSQHWEITKPAASGRRGIVVAQAGAAAAAGIAALEAGGNAIDAAVATGFALAVVEPWNSGLGGIGFALVQPEGAARAEVVDFGPKAPAGLDPNRFPLTGRMKQDLFAWPEVVDDANIHGPLSFVVPMTVAGYALMHQRWGRLALADVMAPAVALARRGLPADWFTTLKIANSAAVLRRYPESARIYLPEGLPPVAPYQGTPGFLHLGRLAETLEQLRRQGLADFYQGEIAQALIADVAAMGGVLTAADLRGAEARVLPAMAVSYHGRVWQLASGLTAAPTLAGVLARLETIPHGGQPDATWFAALARTLKAGYAERLAGLGDAEPKGADSCTTHFTVCDAAGGMVAVTSTLLSSMGSRVVLPQTGVLMNNGVMWFDPRPGQPNSVAPGKRPLTNMCPVIIREGARPMLAGGGSGGRRIMAAVLQTLAFVTDFALTPEAAAHHPRIDVSDAETVHADRRLAPEIVAALRETGAVEMVEHGVLPINFACPNFILAEASGMRTGISDVQSPWSAALAEG